VFRLSLNGQALGVASAEFQSSQAIGPPPHRERAEDSKEAART
jgi:hypothetical protein